MRFGDLKPGDIFTMETKDCRLLKTQNLYYFNADTDSQRMEIINAVRLDDGDFIYVARGMEVERCD